MPHLDHRAFVNDCRDERGVGHHTLRAYAQDLRTFARFTEAHRLSDPLSKDDILAYHRHLRDALGAKPATIERRLVTLKSYFAWREDRNSALPSPFADVRISVRIPRRLPRPIDRDTLRAVLHEGEDTFAVRSKSGADDAIAASQNDVTILIIKLLIVTGLRISELTNVKVRDVSHDGSQILVNGKGNRERIVFVPNHKLQEELRHFLEARYAQSGSSAPLFLNTGGRRLRSATFRKRLRALSRRLGIEPHLTPHRFRHSAATLLIEEGIDIRMVQALLGHASLRTTEIYVRVSNHALRRALERADILDVLRN
ncbi:tyrosine-type recombinase/integrase [Oceanicola sp. 502str15]|uniref:tyrosine-type recombinase/integrase n=1 Tax=Oceanicola sp. 502str15 TaxID=2696061 RepID=UPI00209550F0|nr:tyrosine-type recombinase/integrase [Oceanicola sp. 502str15]MCO6385188.1 tyrosine-type recombinase/integrase [Oceanicola sp. 502str15]